MIASLRRQKRHFYDFLALLDAGPVLTVQGKKDWAPCPSTKIGALTPMSRLDQSHCFCLLPKRIDDIV